MGKEENMKKANKFISAMLTISLAFGALILPARADEGASYDISPSSNRAARTLKSKNESDWTICVYLCGTDLESDESSATYNLLQMLEADIPENVTVLVMTGGTYEWDPLGLADSAEKDKTIKKGAYYKPDPNHTQIFEVTDDKMKLLYTYKENMAMNDMATAAEFMEFALRYAPSEHLMIDFWDHGGGPLGEAVIDEYTREGASATEIADFAEAVNDARGDKVDIMGFDACMMSSIEIANLLSPYADYLVASEEVEPNNGWNYKWLSGVGGSAEDVGKRIVDYFGKTYSDEDEWSDALDITLALTDLSQIGELRDAFNKMAEELNDALINDPKEYALIARKAMHTKIMYDGWDGLIDLYDFADEMKDILPSAQGVIDALGTPPGSTPELAVGEASGESPAVIYRGVGSSYSECLGMSFYYPTVKTHFGTNKKNKKNLELYRSFGLSDTYSDYIDAHTKETSALQTFKGEFVVGYDSETYDSVLTITDPDDVLAIKSVYLKMLYLPKTEDGEESSYLLGTKSVTEDWDNAIFTAAVPEEWFSLNDEIFTIEKTETDLYGQYEIYSMPVVIGDNDFLSYMALYKPVDESIYYIVGITDDDGTSSAADRTYMPEGDFTFKPVLINDEDEEDYIVNKPYTITEAEAEKTEGYALQPGYTDLEEGDDALYSVHFVATDMKDNEYETNASDYIIINDFSEISIDDLPPQIYTGGEVTPRLSYSYKDEGNLRLDLVDVRYENNVNVGTATVTVTSLDEEMPGSLSAEFEIKPLEEIFGDLGYDDWEFDAVNYMYSNGYMTGAGENSFAPDAPMTRAMTVTTLYNISDGMGGTGDVEFEDVHETDDYYKDVRWAVSNKIAFGFSDTYFGPEDRISREQFMAMLYRCEQRNGGGYDDDEEYKLPYSDADEISEYALEAASWLNENNILTGYSDNTLRPKDYITRAEAAAVMEKYLER